MENLQSFVQEQWWALVIAFVIIGAIVRMVKTVVKWVLTGIIVVLMFTFATTYTPDLVNEAKNMATETIKEQALKALQEKAAANDLEFVSNDDGSYIVSTKGIQLKGTPGSNDVQLSYMGQTVTLPFDKTLQLIVDQAKQQPATE